jgi:hypothetical protein
MTSSTYSRVGAGVAAVIAGGLLIGAPAPVGAASLQASPSCPAIDTEPLCELRVSADDAAGSGVDVALVPNRDTATWTGDAKDHPGYGPVDPGDSTSELVDDIGAGCARQPGPVIACPG